MLDLYSFMYQIVAAFTIMIPPFLMILAFLWLMAKLVKAFIRSLVK